MSSGAGARPEYVRQAAEDSPATPGNRSHRSVSTAPARSRKCLFRRRSAWLDDLVRVGKVREIGCSNFSGDQLRAAEAAVPQGGARFVSVQNQYSLVHREPEAGVIPECVRLRIAFLPFSRWPNGLLTGKYRRCQPPPEGSRARDGFGPKVFTDENLAIVESLAEFAAAGRAHHAGTGGFRGWPRSPPAVAVGDRGREVAGAGAGQCVRSRAGGSTRRIWKPSKRS